MESASNNHPSTAVFSLPYYWFKYFMVEFRGPFSFFVCFFYSSLALLSLPCSVALQLC